MIRLDIFSDPVCPWCLIGKANLDRAGGASGSSVHRLASVSVEPEMPAEGVEKRPYLVARFGSAARSIQIHAHLRQMAKDAGVAMDPDKPEMLPNAMNAHRMIHWAGIEGKQAAMVSVLFRAYWRDGRDIGDVEELTDIAEEIGMDPKAVARLLATDADMDDLRARDRDARQKGVTAVPAFLIAQQYVVSGAQPPEVWAQVIEELVAKSKE